MIADAYVNLGMLLKERSKYDDAESAFRSALAIDPKNSLANWDLSHILLDRCQFHEGWLRYEARYFLDNDLRHIMGTTQPEVPGTLYHGEDLHGKYLFVWPEQGIGDEVMFASVLSDLEAFGADVTIACDKRLVSLYERSFPFANIIPKDPANRYLYLENAPDYHLAIGSLPRYFRKTIDDYKRTVPYLKADTYLTEKWKKRFSNLEHNFTIGLSWRGGNDRTSRQQRSIDLTQLTPILGQDVNAINLQYGDHREEISRFTETTGIRLHDWDDADPLKDLENFVAQIKALDLVVSIDNSSVHFAGAVGCQTIVLLPTPSEYRWTRHMQNSYWYPDIMHLYRRQKDEDWQQVISSVAASVRKMLNS
jgi:tetratricopeptide (TPR) repeat protein